MQIENASYKQFSHTALPRSNSQGRASVAWTARRCGLLLRPLESQLASLRKLAQQRSSGTTSFDAKAVDGTRLKPCQDSDLDGSSFDRMRKVKRTYARRPSRKSGRGFGRSPSFSTTRVFADLGQQLTQDDETANSHVAVFNRIYSDPELEDRVRRSVARTNPSSDDIFMAIKSCADSPLHSYYAGILRTMQALLSATESGRSEHVRTLSLSMMCLRRIPQYMAELNSLRRLEEADENNTSSLDRDDAAGEVFTVVEDLAPRSDDLRQIVKSHAARLLAEAIRDGLVPADVRNWLVRRLASNRHFHEAEVLLAAWVNRPHREPTISKSDLTESSLNYEIATLAIYASTYGRLEFLFSTITHMLRDGHLSKEWLRHPNFKSLWDLGGLTLHSKAECHITYPFMAASIGFLVRSNEWESKASSHNNLKTVSLDLATGLTGFLTTMEAGLDPSSGIQDETRRATAARSLRLTLKSSLENMEAYSQRLDQCQVFQWHVAAFLADPEYCWIDWQSSRDIIAARWLAETPARRTKRQVLREVLYDSILELIAFRVQKFGFERGEPRQSLLMGLCNLIGTLELQGLEMDSLRKDAAFRLAQRSNDLRDLTFAEDLASSLQSCRKTPMKVTSTGATYCWDAGISEWITSTPRVAIEVERRRSNGRELKISIADSPYPAQSQNDDPLESNASDKENDLPVVSTICSQDRACTKGKRRVPGAARQPKIKRQKRQAGLGSQQQLGHLPHQNLIRRDDISGDELSR
jgi:hypothetical protein